MADNDDLVYLSIDLAPGATLTITPDAGGKVRLVNMYSTLTLDGSVKFVSGAATALSGDMAFKAGSGPCFRSSVDEPFLRTAAAGDVLKITPTTGGLDGFLAYYIEGA